MTGITIPCGKCLVCRRNRAREWAQRLKHELQFWHEYCFITLTYDDEYVPYLEGDLTLWKYDLQLFWKRLRKSLKGRKIKYLASGEYGDRTSRPHYHAIIFGWQPKDVIRLSKDIVVSEELANIWGFGQASVGSVTDNSIHYVTGYILKKLPEKARGKREKEFICVSQGMGLKYAEMYSDDLKKSGQLLTDGVDKGIPMYYRRKLEIDKLVLAKRRIAKEFAVEKTLRSRGRDLGKQVDEARVTSELELKHKLSRQAKSGL